MQWLMLQQPEPDDYVIATGEQHSVREFVELAGQELGIPIRWDGRGIKEKGIDENNGKIGVAIDPRYFRPTEVEFLLADPAKAKKKLGWEPKVTFQELVRIMIAAEIEPLGELEQSRDIIRKIMNNKAGKR